MVDSWHAKMVFGIRASVVAFGCGVCGNCCRDDIRDGFSNKLFWVNILDCWLCDCINNRVSKAENDTGNYNGNGGDGVGVF